MSDEHETEPAGSGYDKVRSVPGTNNPSSFYSALAYGFGDEFAASICAAIDKRIENRAESAIIAARQKDWIRHVGECAVHHKSLTGT